MQLQSIPGYLVKQAEDQPEAAALRHKKDGEWQPITWGEYASQVEQAGRALIGLGLEWHGRVCILGFNRPEWVIFDVAAMMAGGVPAGIYETSSMEGVGYIVSHSEARVVLVENQQQLEKLLGQRKKLPDMKYIVLMDGEADDPGILSWGQFLEKAREVDRGALEKRFKSLRANEIATLIYTSGTTGPPKGVMLSHNNLTWTARTAIDMFQITRSDSSVSYLPLSHIAEQMFTVHAPIIAGWRIDFAESLEKVGENLKEVQPTIFFGVPRVWEKVYAAIYGRLHEVKGIKAALVSWARGAAGKVHRLRNDSLTEGWGLGVRYKLTQKLVLSKLKSAIGLGNARFCACGAAPISETILKFFSTLDIPILEVYGQSEGSGPTTFNRRGRTRYGSVGPAFPGVEVQTKEDGEIILRGKNVFLGYFKDEAATEEALIDGWLHSGDLGRFDEDKFLWITGRKKEIIVTAGGKNITPVYIEGLVKKESLIEQCVVIGDQRKHITALITLNEQAAAHAVEEKDLSSERLHESEAVREIIQRGIDNANAKLSRVENIRKFRIIPRLFSQEHGELTPTLKLVRHTIEKNWADLIEEMYTEDA